MTSPAPNVLLVSQNYHPIVGGVETHARHVAKELARQGHRVTVAAMNFRPPMVSGRLLVLDVSLLAPAYGGYQDGPLPVRSLSPTRLDRLRMLPIALRVLPLVRRYADAASNRFGYRFYRSVYVRRLRRLMRGVNAEVVHSLAGGYLGWAAQEAAGELGLPFVSTPFVHPKQWGDGADDVAYYKRADAVIGLVPTDTEYLASIGVAREKLHVIGVSPELPPTVDPDGFRARHGVAGVPVVLYVGRMMPQKGAQAVLAAARHVWDRHRDARFVFIGPASEAEAAAFAGADRRVTYLGKVSLQEKADALAACDVFCMPSMSEILPTVYLEAWSYSKTVVGGLAHGLVELVEGNGAGIAASQEPRQLAAVLTALLGDTALRAKLGGRGRELVEQRYSVQAVTSSLVALYSALSEKRERLTAAAPAPINTSCHAGGLASPLAS